MLRATICYIEWFRHGQDMLLLNTRQPQFHEVMILSHTLEHRILGLPDVLNVCIVLCSVHAANASRLHPKSTTATTVFCRVHKSRQTAMRATEEVLNTRLRVSSAANNEGPSGSPDRHGPWLPPCLITTFLRKNYLYFCT